VIELRISQKLENLYSRWATTGFSRMDMLQGVRRCLRISVNLFIENGSSENPLLFYRSVNQKRLSVEPTNDKGPSSSSNGTTAHCGLWPVEQHPSIFPYLSPTLSIFSLPALEDLSLLPISTLSWVFPFVSSLPVRG
jgi:hypothetical protein